MNKNKLLKQKQKQSQKQTVIVNIGNTKSKNKSKQRQSKKKNLSNQLSMFSPPLNIYSYPPTFRENETAPRVSIPSRTEPYRYTPFAEQPRRQREFFTETSTVEFLPSTTEGIVNEYTDEPLQINSGIIDKYNPNTNQTEYIQSQNPKLNMTVNNNLFEKNEDDNKIINNFDKNNKISSKFIKQPIDNTFDNLFKKNDDDDDLTIASVYSDDETIKDFYYNPIKMKKRIYIPKEVNNENNKKLPYKKNGVELSLSDKSIEELREIANILGIDINLNGKKKSRSKLMNDINFDMDMRRKPK